MVFLSQQGTARKIIIIVYYNLKYCYRWGMFWRACLWRARCGSLYRSARCVWNHLLSYQVWEMQHHGLRE